MIRAARVGDVPDIYRLIRALAEYERSLPSVTGTEDDLRQALFGAQPMDQWNIYRLSGPALRALGSAGETAEVRSSP